MAHYLISTSALIPAPAERVYAIIADYRSSHPLILPKPYFAAMQVEQGGTGSGTVIALQMQLLGKVQDFRLAISEPQPGRVLVETNETNGAVTRFFVEPRREGKEAFVTIETALLVRQRLAGRLEGWLAARVLRPVYVKELQQLARVASEA